MERLVPLFVRFLVAASIAVTSATRADEPNHYILGCALECPLKATEWGIGPPGAVVSDAAGNVYFSSPNVVLKLRVDGALERIAGNGVPGFSGDGGRAVDATLSFPQFYPELEADPLDYTPLVGALAIDTLGNVYIADAYNSRIRRIDVAGMITTILAAATSSDPNEADMRFKWPQGVAVAATGDLYVSTAWGHLSRIATDGVVTTLAESNCGAFATPGLCVPEQIALDANGDVYVPDAYCRVRRIAADGTMVTLAGDARPSRSFIVSCGYAGEGTVATSTMFSQSVYGVAVDAGGNVYVADTGNDCIRKIDAGAIVTTVAGVCRHGGFAGDGGLASEAKLRGPRGVAVDGNGNLYIADTGNYRLRKVTTDGTITTVAGNGARFPSSVSD